MFYQYLDKRPQAANSTWVADGAKVIGDVSLGEETSVWYNAVIRGDLAPITIGKRTNIQDNCVIHVNHGQPVLIEDEVTVGHSAILHGCTIKKNALIGAGAIILNDSVIGEESIVAAGSLVTERKIFPPRVMIMGSPAKVIRDLTEEELAELLATAPRYAEKAAEHRNNIRLT